MSGTGKKRRFRGINSHENILEQKISEAEPVKEDEVKTKEAEPVIEIPKPKNYWKNVRLKGSTLELVQLILQIENNKNSSNLNQQDLLDKFLIDHIKLNYYKELKTLQNIGIIKDLKL